MQTLAVQRTINSRGYFLRDGEIIDYLPDEDGAVFLMSRATPPIRTLAATSAPIKKDWAWIG